MICSAFTPPLPNPPPAPRALAAERHPPEGEARVVTTTVATLAIVGPLEEVIAIQAGNERMRERHVLIAAGELRLVDRCRRIPVHPRHLGATSCRRPATWSRSASAR